MDQNSPHYKFIKITGLVDRQRRPKETQISKLLDIAVRFHEQGNLPEAETTYRSILREDFEYADAWHLLGVVAFQAGYQDIAIELISEAISIDPEEPFYHNNLGNVHRQLGALQAAEKCYRQALRIQPDYSLAHYNLATLLRDQARLDDAVDAYRTVLRLKPDDFEALNDLGATLRQLGDVESAIGIHKKAIRLQPKTAYIRVNLGLAFEQQGDTDSAIACYQEAIEIDPRHIRAYQCLADLTTFTIDDQDKIAQLESLLNDKKLSEFDVEYVHWVLGKVYDDCGLFDKAFKHHEVANSCKRQRKQLAFDVARNSKRVSRLIAVCTRKFFAEQQYLGSDSSLPVFVIGLPRAGKTLAESLMVRHPEIHGAGEVEYFSQLTHELPDRLETADLYPECVSSIDSETANIFAEGYVQELRKHSSQASRIVNTIPDFLHLGLIALLFPKASIIHCRRDPLDVCLSIYFRSFNVSHSYAYDLTDIAHYYREYERLMDHWYRVLPGRMLTLDYEDMVSNEDATRHRLIEWCGLADDTKEDDTQRDYTPLSTHYVGRWRNYDEFIEPLKRGLGY